MPGGLDLHKEVCASCPSCLFRRKSFGLCICQASWGVFCRCVRESTGRKLIQL